MFAASYTRTGPAAEVLSVGEMAAPVAAPGEVLVRVHASGINPADVKRRGGWRGIGMDHPLIIPHTDGAGEIVDVGSGIDRGRIGERVWMWNAQGGYGEAGRAFGTAAEFIAIASHQAVRLADALSFADGANLGVPAMTAYRAVFADGPVTDQTIFVNGAAGAVGHFAVQMAVAGGARVIGTVSTAEAAVHVKEAGAFATINRKREDVSARILELTGAQGVDRVIEVDFGANLELDAAVLKRNGTVASYSSSSDPTPVLPYYAFAAKGANLRFIQGFLIPEDQRLAGEKMIAELADAGRLKVAIGATFPLEDIARAHERVERGSLGNVVVLIGGAK
ncbi:NADPH:quinone reductase [Neorhizobium galegae]|uniref:NADPH:quinone reductase n=1 Tax=Neorhizobium galegae TaxID=399 RepID=UPI000620FBCE|nr:NADPH:quinone reductase [Neorhizobium galegae]MCQ1570493.1 NADPH:quinone reductase [Neorhizobium galegae]CDZ63827.1 NADPH:quinone reductase [Neorhizobium galegae bv. orientalis]CDZ71724.1 NADPH:quinone reductase [Neorhizobium galegae bv. orientalis]